MLLNLFLGMFLLSAASVGLAEDGEKVKTIKECKVSFTSLMFNRIVKMDIKITQGSDQKLKGHVSQVIDGVSGSFCGTTIIKTYSIRENLLSSTRSKELNEGESILVHSDKLIREPSYNGRFKTGVDLQKVRSVRLYFIGNKTVKGSTVVVEAWDNQKKHLGSFLGGFLLSPCIGSRVSTGAHPSINQKTNHSLI